MDNTRWMRKPDADTGIDAFLENSGRTYRRDLLISEGLDIEVWFEKDALAGVVLPITAKYDVPLMVSRGFALLSFLYSPAQQHSDGVFIYIFTDFDAAGATIERKITDSLREFSNKTLHVKRAMLSEEQVTAWQLPTREPKKKQHNPCDSTTR